MIFAYSYFITNNERKKVLTIKQSHHQNPTFLDMRQTIACLFDYEITNVILFGPSKQNSI